VDEFHRRTKETQLELASVGFNTALYWENDDVRRAVSIVPTSAITGEGMPDLLLLITSLSQKLLTERLMFNPTLEATVLEVKVIEGLGTTIDIILTGGTIKEGDTIVVVGLDGPIEATIRALLTPHPMKEMRVRGQYHHHKQIRAAQGIKISADGMEKAVAGTQLLVAQDPSDEDEMAYLREEVMKDFATILQSVDKSGEGVYVQASTLGSLEALLEFLRTSEVPVSGINIGPVFKKDVTRASAMLEKRKEYATILAFDVPVEKDAREMAEDVGVTVFTADIIYNLFDMFTEHMANHKKARQEEVKDDVVFPCILKVLQEHVFNKKDPIILGVDVSEGVLRVGCPLAVRSGDAWLDIGRVVSMEVNTKPAVIARAGESVCVKIQSSKTAHVTYGRHFTWTDSLVSKMSREAIDLLKSDFRTDLGKVEWLLVIRLKKAFGII
jgi:translation initiation factor 5B